MSQCPSRVFWVGIGCKRGTSRSAIEQAMRSVFQAYELPEAAIAGIATIDTKANESGLIEFCRDRGLPLRCFTAEVLRSVTIPNPSRAIAAAVGTPSVAEAAALLASRRSPHCTPVLCVPKQIIRTMGHSGLVTVAIAQR